MDELYLRTVQRRLHALVAAMPADDQVPLARWLHRMSASDDPHDQAIIALLLDGKARITEMTAAGARVTLTEAGRNEVLDLLDKDAAARAQYGELTGHAVVPPPKREQ